MIIVLRECKMVNMNLDFLLRGFTILIFFITRLYWYLAKQGLHLEKQKELNKWLVFEKIGIILSAFIIVLNILGFTIFKFENIFIQIIGFILVILGCSEAILGRFALSNNWTECYEYQIKNKHKLIVNGLYKYVRHPIYGGFTIAIIGAFLVAKTYLFLPIFLLILLLMTRFAKREEKLLKKYFGKEYINYMQKTKMLIPFVY